MGTEHIAGRIMLGLFGLALLVGGALVVRRTLRGHDTWELVDEAGRTVADGFVQPGPFRHGLAPARVGSRWGYVHRDGAMRIAPTLAAAEPYDAAGYAQAQSTETALWGLLTTRGTWAIEPAHLAFGAVSPDGLVPVRTSLGLRVSSATQRVSVGLYDLSAGQWRVPPARGASRWTDATEVRDGRLAVRTARGWHLVDDHGRPVNDAIFDRLWAPAEGRIRFEQDGRQGFLDLDGDVVCAPRPGRSEDFVDGAAIVRDRDRAWLIAPDCTPLSAPFRDLRAPGGGLVAALDDDGSWGFVDIHGSWVLPAAWNDVADEGFSTGVARVATDAGTSRTWHWIHRDGRVLASARRLTRFADGRGFRLR